MRWNCPHCSVALSVADDSLNSGWSYAKCFNCSGFAMVRRTDVNLIKMPNAPSSSSPQVRPAAARRSAPSPATFPMASSDRLVTRPSSMKVIDEPRLQSTRPAVAPPAFVPKVPEVKGTSIKPEHRTGFREKILPVGLGLAGVMAITSGVYLYIQGQQIWEKAQTVPVKPQVETRFAGNPTTQQQEPANSNDFSDQVHQKAMAPTRPSVPASEISTSSFFVKVRNIHATLRSGPGIDNSALGIANPATELQVTDWKDRWFKVAVLSNDVVSYAWIRNDLVDPVKNIPTEDSNQGP